MIKRYRQRFLASCLNPSLAMQRFGILCLVTAMILAACGGVPRPLSQGDQRQFRFTETRITQSSLLKDRDLATNVTEDLGDRWRFWLHGQRPMSMTIEIHPDSADIGPIVTQSRKSDSFLARIILRDIQTNQLIADFVHKVVLNSQASLRAPSDQLILDQLMSQQFVEELFAMFYYGNVNQF